MEVGNWLVVLLGAKGKDELEIGKLLVISIKKYKKGMKNKML